MGRAALDGLVIASGAIVAGDEEGYLVGLWDEGAFGKEGYLLGDLLDGILRGLYL